MLLFCILVSPVFGQPGQTDINTTTTDRNNDEQKEDKNEKDTDNQKEQTVVPMDTEGIVRILVVFVVLSVVFEVALTPIFNWRLFLKYCYKKGCKTPIAVALASLVFWVYDLDLITQLLGVLGHEFPARMIIANTTPTTTPGGKFLTALLIAGGSAGIFRIFTKLGIRNPMAIDEKVKETLEKLKERDKQANEES